ncbi:MAG: hypothetical protein ABI647_22860 [Gemmatimonadota bacterium]
MEDRAAFLALALLTGCGGEGGSGPVMISVALDRADSTFGAVRVEGLTASALERATAPRTGAVAVFATPGSLPEGAPPLAGSWRRTHLTLEFRPAFPPSAGLSLWVRIDTAALEARSENARPLLRRFDLPPAAGDSAATLVTAIHPAANSVPENLLRFYLEFSAPMRPGQALAHIRLLDDRGVEVRNAFLELLDELWDPAGCRLTLLFDPGRVKRGIRTNLESGRALHAGRRYALRVLAGWPDARGNPLARGAEKRFVATAADYTGPVPESWHVVVPAVGSAGPLEVQFGEPLDHALARRLLAVQDEAGHPIGGEVTLQPGDRIWRFVPTGRWLAGRHQLLVSPELEDVAGNRPGRPFDADITRTPAGSPPTKPIIRWFTPRAPELAAQLR